MTGVTIWPLHWSWRKHLKRHERIKPRNMSRLPMPVGMSDGLTDIAMEIFADCTNAAVPFQDAITAVYLSGLQHGHQITKDQP